LGKRLLGRFEASREKGPMNRGEKERQIKIAWNRGSVKKYVVSGMRRIQEI